MTLLDLSLPSYIPTTVLGLLGLLFAYLYGYYRNKDNNKLEQLKTIRASDRSKVVEMLLNDLGVQIDTSSLNSKQKYELVVKLLSTKTRKYLIISITLIILSFIIAFLIWSNYHLLPQNLTNTSLDTTRTSDKVAIHDTTLLNPSTRKTSNEDSNKTINNVPSRPKHISKRQSKDVAALDKSSIPTYSIYLYSKDVSDADAWVDGNFIGKVFFKNGLGGTLDGVKAGIHTLEFRNFRIGGNIPDKVEVYYQTEIKIGGDDDYELYIEKESGGPELNFHEVLASKVRKR